MTEPDYAKLLEEAENVLPKPDPRLATMMQACGCLVRYMKDPKAIGVVEGWVPALAYVRVNMATGEELECKAVAKCIAVVKEAPNALKKADN
jgi:hypothetical protein